jgi:hypothetical protein
MTPNIERVELLSDTDLRRVLEQVHADRVPRVIERNGEAVAVVVHPTDFSKAPAEPKSRRYKNELLSFAGIWRDLDGDRLIEYIREGRRTSPASPPIDL